MTAEQHHERLFTYREQTPAPPPDKTARAEVLFIQPSAS